MAIVDQGQTKTVMDQYKFSGYPNKETAFLAAQICIANLVRALDGIVSEKRVRRAVRRDFSKCSFTGSKSKVTPPLIIKT